MNVTDALLTQKNIAQMAIALKKQHPRFELLWLLGVHTGLRISDLLQIRRGDVKHLMHVTESKTKKIRKFDLSAELLEMIRKFSDKFGLSKAEFLFFSHISRKHKPMSRQWAHRVIARTAKQEGLSAIAPHSMRKTYACNFWRSNRNLELVRRAMNHKHLSVTLLYLRSVLENFTLSE